MLLPEKLGPIGLLLAQTAPDLLIDQSSLPRKQDWKQALMYGRARQLSQARYQAHRKEHCHRPERSQHPSEQRRKRLRR